MYTKPQWILLLLPQNNFCYERNSLKRQKDKIIALFCSHTFLWSRFSKLGLFFSPHGINGVGGKKKKQMLMPSHVSNAHCPLSIKSLFFHSLFIWTFFLSKRNSSALKFSTRIFQKTGSLLMFPKSGLNKFNLLITTDFSFDKRVGPKNSKMWGFFSEMFIHAVEICLNNKNLSILFYFILFYFIYFVLLGPHTWYMVVPRLGVELEL